MRIALVLLVACGACNSFLDNNQNQSGLPTLVRVGSFNNPVYLTAAPGDTGRLFVVEQDGRIQVLHHDTVQARPFLDITAAVRSGGEQGLLSMAFDPQYATNGRFFVYFNVPDSSIRVVRYNVSAGNPDSADQTTADTIIKIDHTKHSNHNGGHLQFGPDGMLWVGVGDGGGGGDPDGNGQNKHALLAKLLRLDVSGASGYAIPSGNPGNIDTTFAPEVFAYGLRNPWRFSFDRQTGDLYIADVGQDRYEEVDVAPTAVQRVPGANYGWNIMEAKHCYPVDGCTPIGNAPFVEYAHVFSRCSITGGYVYHGSALPAIQGHYFFADFCDGSVWSIIWPDYPTPAQWTQLEPPGGFISSFGQDAKGELYIVQLGGDIWRIVPLP